MSSPKKTTNKRAVLFLWMKRWFKIKEGIMLPWYLIGFRCILFPSDIIWLFVRKADPRYDVYRNTFHIRGRKYAGELFDAWGRPGGWPEGAVYRLGRTEEGLLTIQRLPQYEQKTISAKRL